MAGFFLEVVPTFRAEGHMSGFAERRAPSDAMLAYTHWLKGPNVTPQLIVLALPLVVRASGRFRKIRGVRPLAVALLSAE